LKAKEVGYAAAAIDGSRETCRQRECEMGNLVSDAVLDRVKDQGVTIVFSNGGGLRASIDQGKVTMGEVLTVLPFQNTVATFKLGGKDVVAALENGVSQLEDGAGRFAQVAGLKYSFDRSRPVGGRVSDVEVMESGAWTPIDPDKDYIVATNNYVRQGGDGYKIFADKARDAYDYGPGLEQVVADYLGAHNPYTPKLEGRITEIGAKTTAQAEPATPPEAATSEPAKPAGTPPAETAMPDLPAGSSDIANTPPTVAAEPAKPAQAESDQQPTEMASNAETSHVVARGDTYWGMAVEYYGDGAMWKSIADANPGYQPRRLPVGASLKIPAK
jgi:5'-nucleotidase